MSSKKQPNLEDLLFFISKKGNRVALSSIVRISPTAIYLNTGSTLNIKDSEDLAQLEAKLVAFEEYKLSKQQADLDAKIAKLTKADIVEHTEVLKDHLTDVFNTILKQSEQTSEKVTRVVNNQINLVGTLTTNLNAATRNISSLSSQMTRLTSNGEDLTSMMEAITKTKTELEGTIKLLKECLDV